MTWIASSPDARREQFGRFLLGTGNIGGVAATTGPGIGLSDEEGLDLIDRALAEGARIIDTSDIYAGGNSERVVGTWRQSHLKSDALIQTKTGVTAGGPNLAPERVRHQLQRSIAALGRVDLYLAHTVDPNTSWSDSLPVFSTAVESGRIRAYGLSNVDEAALSSALETADRLGLIRPKVFDTLPTRKWHTLEITELRPHPSDPAHGQRRPVLSAVTRPARAGEPGRPGG